METLRERAHDLIESKMLFDADLKLALEKAPTNKELLLIRDVINDVFHPINKDQPPVTKNQTSFQQGQQETQTNEADVDLADEEFDEVDLVEYVRATQENVSIFDPDEVNDGIPSFSLGIDEDIFGEDMTDDTTPIPMIREKSTRLQKLGRFGKSPYVERILNIEATFTSQEVGLWRYTLLKADPM